MASGLTTVPLELDTPWEAAVTPEGHVLYTELQRGLSVYTAGKIQRVPRHTTIVKVLGFWWTFLLV
jgi:hypothetical protein